MSSTASSKFITVESVRHFIRDRKVEDNLLHADLRYNNDEILHAMERTAGAYNDFPPAVIAGMNADRLPRNRTAFYHGITCYLYIAKIAQLQENEVHYTAGEVQTDQEARLIQHLQSSMEFHRQMFQEGAAALKLGLNAKRAGGAICG